MDLGADAVVIDCFHDGAEPDLALLRACSRSLIDARGPGRSPQVWFRIHPAFSQECASELGRLAGIGEGLILPQVRSTDDVEWVADRATDVNLLPVIENQDAMSRVVAIAAHPAVCRLGFSARGFAQEAIDGDGLLAPAEALLWQRRIVASAAASAGLPGPVNGVHGAGEAAFDTEAFTQDAGLAVDAGFTGQCVTDPAQLVHLRARFGDDAPTG
ncbi:hypothetical protein [Streptomyces sp. NPDC000410]|uniref:hypothetical protein n=1 Tax=Streptomyces sp. NPDC000410 TaxID=3154254 RepID=UPI00331DDB11